MAISKTQRVFVLLALIVVFFIALIRASKDFFVGMFSRPTSTQKAQRQPHLFPIVDEDAKTAGQPLKTVVASLDFEKDPKAWDTFDTIVMSRLRHEKFDDLDAAADDFIRTKEKFVGGRWKIFGFQDTLCEVSGGRDMPDSAWQEHFARFRKWIRTKPNSKTARIAYGQAMMNYAWHARGSGYANEVTREGWRLFGERLAEARQILEDARSVGGEHPHWYYAMQGVALGQSWDRAEYDALFDEATRKEPLYWRYYITKALYLLPRWHGTEGEWEAFAEEAANKVGGDDGDALYYFIAVNQMDFFKRSQFFKESKVSWPRMKKGFAAIEKKYKVTNQTRNFYAQIAGIVCDQAEAQRMIKDIGENWSPDTWRTKEEYERFKKWAATGKKE
jgi:hypothetical protein